MLIASMNNAFHATTQAQKVKDIYDFINDAIAYGGGGQSKDGGTFGTPDNPTELAAVTVTDTKLEKEGTSTFKAALAIAATTSAVDGPLPIGEIVGGVILAGALVYDATQITFITYTLTGPGGETYVGRSSGFGTPEVIMRNRFASHHKRLQGYTNPQLDRAVQGIHGYSAIRGREQQMIDFYGGVGSSGVGNSIRGVSRYNPAGIFYHGAANNFFGNIAPYTGWRP
ncbi:MAG TPA: hypothetical protein PKX92_07515 [Edaphocola sp.]|nr:hypothetical protein [Edaphocola sp.]